ncbi:hypothetical protein RRG08_005638 [Elysia crispata]|uniref:Homeobox domain-containing protein n=1 Tax=Elysia crispata TaxID=231223 RepID=A0AAE1D783_9GAST|nr:hypothetical protein RRG08_005638 [Elysia crispata]
MTAAVAIMASSNTTPSAPKRHGFSIDSLLGKTEPAAASPPLPMSAVVSPPIATSTPSRPLALRLLPPSHREDKSKEDRQRERERERERETQREKEMIQIKERESRDRERQLEILRERDLVMESMREMRELREREMARERDVREFRDIREGQGSNPGLHAGLLGPSPRSSMSPPSPRGEKSLTPESENRLSSNSSSNGTTNNHISVSSAQWAGDEFKHLLNNFSSHPGQLDSGSLYQPLRVCNRTLASMAAAAAAAGLPGGPGNGHAGPGGPLAVGAMGPQFGQLPINPLLYNIPRELSSPHHPLLAARYPGLMHHRYPMGPPPGPLFYPFPRHKPKRNRTAFSPSQLLQLEQAFEKNHYVVGQERKSLAAKLQLTETQNHASACVEQEPHAGSSNLEPCKRLYGARATRRFLESRTMQALVWSKSHTPVPRI